MPKWKTIPGYEGYYEASSCGQVRSVDRYVENNGGEQFRPGVVLTPNVSRKDGYVRTQLKKDGAVAHFATHRLMFEVFKGYLPDYVDHIDRDKTNNSISNLREATATEQNFNTNLRADNKTGRKGVFYVKEKKDTTPWRARITIQGKMKTTYHSTYDEACASRERMEARSGIELI